MHAVHRSKVSSGRAALLAKRARALREFATVSERRLWVELSAGKLGVCFRRQVPLAGRFIADFFAPAIGLVVEVDGSIHERTRHADARRDEVLRRAGYHVLRLEAELVLRDPPRAVARVSEAVALLQQ